MATLDELLQQAVGAGGYSVIMAAGRRPKARAGGHYFDLDAPAADEVALHSMLAAAFPDRNAAGELRGGGEFVGTYHLASGAEYTVKASGSGGSLAVSVLPAAAPAPAARGIRRCVWCGMETVGTDCCASCLGRTHTRPSVGGELRAEPDTRPGEWPGDAAVPVLLRGYVPPRLGHDAKPLPAGVGGMEPPRDL